MTEQNNFGMTTPVNSLFFSSNPPDKRAEIPAASPLQPGTPEFAPHRVDRLRRYCEAQSTRVFTARGYSLKRCRQCMLGLNTCICSWRQSASTGIEFVLLMHRDEVFKPTNTGRLVADLFPGHSHAFLWDRTRPPPELLALLNDPGRHCLLVFPPTEGDGRTVETLPAPRRDDGKILTVILLDGTWKQARKMYSHSVWMKQLPLLDLSDAIAGLDDALGQYRVRQACESGRLATAQAAALCLYAAGEPANSRHLLNYFAVFNEHYIAARLNRQPQALPAHAELGRPAPATDAGYTATITTLIEAEAV